MYAAGRSFGDNLARRADHHHVGFQPERAKNRVPAPPAACAAAPMSPRCATGPRIHSLLYGAQGRDVRVEARPGDPRPRRRPRGRPSAALHHCVPRPPAGPTAGAPASRRPRCRQPPARPAPCAALRPHKHSPSPQLSPPARSAASGSEYTSSTSRDGSAGRGPPPRPGQRPAWDDLGPLPGPRATALRCPAAAAWSAWPHCGGPAAPYAPGRPPSTLPPPPLVHIGGQPQLLRPPRQLHHPGPVRRRRHPRVRLSPHPHHQRVKPGHRHLPRHQLTDQGQRPPHIVPAAAPAPAPCRTRPFASSHSCSIRARPVRPHPQPAAQRPPPRLIQLGPA